MDKRGREVIVLVGAATLKPGRRTPRLGMEGLPAQSLSERGKGTKDMVSYVYEVEGEGGGTRE
jgi:hypothetical protein